MSTQPQQPASAPLDWDAFIAQSGETAAAAAECMEDIAWFLDKLDHYSARLQEFRERTAAILPATEREELEIVAIHLDQYRGRIAEQLQLLAGAVKTLADFPGEINRIMQQ